MSNHSLLQGIFPIQGLNPGLLHYRWIAYHLSHQGSLFSPLYGPNGALYMIFSLKSNTSFLSPGDFPNPGIEPGSPALQAGATRELRARGNTVQSTATWNPPGKNTGVDNHSLLQGIFLTQALNPGLLYFRQILYHLSHQ